MLKINHIDTDFLESLKPCQDRLDNWMEHYNCWSGTLVEFLSLEKISYSDKLWIVFREEALDAKDHIELACRLAEAILPIFECKYPKDKSPREAILAARSGDAVRAAFTADAARAACYAADAYAADADAARAAFSARSAAYAAEAAYAADAAEAAYYAAEAAYTAGFAARAAYYAADKARFAAYDAYANKPQLKIIIEYLNEISERKGESYDQDKFRLIDLKNNEL